PIFAIGVPTRQYWIPLPVLGALSWPTSRAFGLVGFRSTIEQDRLRVQAGILGRRHTESPLERIQLVQVRRPPLRRMFGYETVTMVTGDIGDRKSTRLNSSHVKISYAVFCLK